MNSPANNTWADTSSLRSNWAAVKRGEVFASSDTKPEDWHYEGGCVHVDVEVKCQLCETEILYQFPLKRKDGAGQLMIGRECVVHFYESYFPNGLDVVFDLLEKSFKSTRKDVVAEKLAAFRKLNPAIVAFLLDSPLSKKKEFRMVSIFVDMKDYLTGKSPLPGLTYVSTSKFRAALKRRGYLKPEEMAALKPNLTAAAFFLLNVVNNA